MLLLYISVILVIVFLQQEYVAIPQIIDMSAYDGATKAKILAEFQKYRWLGFIVSPVFLLLRIWLVAMCLFVGGILNDDYTPQRYAVCYSVALRASVVFVVSSVVTCALMLSTGQTGATEIVEHFSLMFLVSIDNLAQWLAIPIAALNVFETAYWFFMAYLYAKVSGRRYWNSLGFVLSSYGVGYLFYIIVLMGLMLYLT